MKNKRGQSTMEYVIILTAIVAAIIFAASKMVRPSVEKVQTDASKAMNTSSDLLTSQLGKAPAAQQEEPQ